jgi:hypothetical protein
MFIWLYRCLSVDQVVLLRPGLYKVIFLASLSLAIQPVASLVWKDQRAWIKFTQRLRPHKSATIDEINHLSEQQQPITWRPYDFVLVRRWRQIIQMSQEASKPSQISSIAG